jgi:hypothetical protein
MVGKNVVEDALRRLDELTLKEAQMVTAAESSFTGERTTPQSMPIQAGRPPTF